MNFRGGTLLKDQTMLASIMKNLPKLETELKRLASQFEVEHGRKVKILGQDIHEMIDRDWEVYNNEKIVKKQATRAKVIVTISLEIMHLNMPKANLLFLKFRRLGNPLHQ